MPSLRDARQGAAADRVSKSSDNRRLRGWGEWIVLRCNLFDEPPHAVGDEEQRVAVRCERPRELAPE